MVNLPCQAVNVGGPNVEIGKYSIQVNVVLPDGSVVVTYTDDLDKAATPIVINNAVSAAAVKAYHDWGGTDPLVVVNVLGGAV